MSMPGNVYKGGYVPPSEGVQQPMAPPPMSGAPNPNYGPPAGYMPVPQYGPQNGQMPIQTPPGFVVQQQQYGMAPPNFGGNMAPAPVMMQPGAAQPMMPGNSMTIPAGIQNCPRGLEYLATIDQLIVKQKVELLEAFTGFETSNKFSVKNALGQNVYYAMEDSDCCSRQMCPTQRAFDMKIFDNFRNEVIHLYRPFTCGLSCFPCCVECLEVSSPPGNKIGTIEQEYCSCAPAFKVKNYLGDVVMRIEGPFCTFSMCGDVDFEIVSTTGENIGKITKQWSGLAREMYTDADTFGVSFPLDCDVRTKALLLGATFLIDAMFFEKGNN